MERPALDPLPLRRARLPSTEELTPYLRRIDQNQWYSNFGSLVTSFEARIAEHFGVTSNNIATVANGTLGLVAALQAQRVVPGQLCAMPSFTFVATPAAAVAAGLKPYFLDVDQNSWALEPAAVELALSDGLSDLGAVIPVSPFGAPLDVGLWDSFSARTGIPVVLDAAWAFDTLDPGLTPAVVSLHATKVLGIGEGGLVITRRPELITAVKQASNFGFSGDHLAQIPTGNYKMSEYAGAIGHAALDAWPARRSSIVSVAHLYREALSDVPGLRLPDWFGERGVTTCAVEFATPIAACVIERLRQLGVEARLWWGNPCHKHPAYANYGHASLPNTGRLAQRVLCLPFYAELSPADILRVRNALIEALHG